MTHPQNQNNVSPAVAEQLAEIAHALRNTVYGEAGFPEWGTKFDDIEEEAMNIGREISRLFMEQSVGSQAEGGVPEVALEPQDGETPILINPHKSKLETPAGDIEWKQPQARLAKARRDFFPSGQSAGD